MNSLIHSVNQTNTNTRKKSENVYVNFKHRGGTSDARKSQNASMLSIFEMRDVFNRLKNKLRYGAPYQYQGHRSTQFRFWVTDPRGPPLPHIEKLENTVAMIFLSDENVNRLKAATDRINGSVHGQNMIETSHGKVYDDAKREFDANVDKMRTSWSDMGYTDVVKKMNDIYLETVKEKANISIDSKRRFISQITGVSGAKGVSRETRPRTNAMMHRNERRKPITEWRGPMRLPKSKLEMRKHDAEHGRGEGYKNIR